MTRLEGLTRPFTTTLPSPERRDYSPIYLAGFLSDLVHKNAEAIAHRHDLERQTQELRKTIDALKAK